MRDPKASNYNPAPSDHASWSADGAFVALAALPVAPLGSGGKGRSVASHQSFRIWELGKPLDEQPEPVALETGPAGEDGEGGGPAIAFSPSRVGGINWLAVAHVEKVRLYDPAAKAFRPETLSAVETASLLAIRQAP
jgi:hypothetical protein